MATCKTYINGYFFEYDCDDPQSLPSPSTQGIQYSIVTDLATEPVSVDFFKQHGRIDFDTDDNLIEEYLKASRQELERYSQLSFGDKTILLTALKLPKNYRLMYGPVSGITDPVSTYTLQGDIVKDANGEDISIEFTTSWTGKGGLPYPIKIAICQYALGLYTHRENIITELNSANLFDQAKRALDRYKNYFFL